ncbi:MAG: hypothetical protein WD036_03635 [Bauldia sp.]
MHVTTGRLHGRRITVVVALATLCGALLPVPQASAEVYRVKVKYPWLVAPGGPRPTAPPAEETFLAECRASPAGRNLDWIEQNCTRETTPGARYNPTEITITKSVPWTSPKP